MCFIRAAYNHQLSSHNYMQHLPLMTNHIKSLRKPRGLQKKAKKKPKTKEKTNTLGKCKKYHNSNLKEGGHKHLVMLCCKIQLPFWGLLQRRDSPTLQVPLRSPLINDIKLDPELAISTHSSLPQQTPPYHSPGSSTPEKQCFVEVSGLHRSSSKVLFCSYFFLTWIQPIIYAKHPEYLKHCILCFKYS